MLPSSMAPLAFQHRDRFETSVWVLPNLGHVERLGGGGAYPPGSVSRAGAPGETVSNAGLSPAGLPGFQHRLGHEAAEVSNT